jgi:hypothetical protein
MAGTVTERLGAANATIWGMRLRLIGLVVTLGACTGASEVTAFTGPTAPPIPLSIEETTAIGALPDGTPFEFFIGADLSAVVVGISAGIVIDVAGEPEAVGSVKFGSPPRDEHFFHHGVDLPPGGGIYIDFYDHILEGLGSDHEEIIAGSIRGTINHGFPGLALDPPFRWATDEEAPLQMEVEFRDFVIRRGCGDLAVACSVFSASRRLVDWS